VGSLGGKQRHAAAATNAIRGVSIGTQAELKELFDGLGPHSDALRCAEKLLIESNRQRIRESTRDHRLTAS
jgi:hypothetical protein